MIMLQSLVKSVREGKLADWVYENFHRMDEDQARRLMIELAYFLDSEKTKRQEDMFVEWLIEWGWLYEDTEE